MCTYTFYSALLKPPSIKGLKGSALRGRYGYMLYFALLQFTSDLLRFTPLFSLFFSKTLYFTLLRFAPVCSDLLRTTSAFFQKNSVPHSDPIFGLLWISAFTILLIFWPLSFFQLHFLNCILSFHAPLHLRHSLNFLTPLFLYHHLTLLRTLRTSSATTSAFSTHLLTPFHHSAASSTTMTPAWLILFVGYWIPLSSPTFNLLIVRVLGQYLFHSTYLFVCSDASTKNSGTLFCTPPDFTGKSDLRLWPMHFLKCHSLRMLRNIPSHVTLRHNTPKYSVTKHHNTPSLRHFISLHQSSDHIPTP